MEAQDVPGRKCEECSQHPGWRRRWVHAGWEVPGDWLTLGLWEPVVLEVEEREVGIRQPVRQVLLMPVLQTRKLPRRGLVT